jgi:polyisoprenoid-binding protein YceI
MKYTIPILLAFFLIACGEEKPQKTVNQDPTACECYEATKEKYEAQMTICAEKEKDEDFAHQIKECQAADIMNVDVSEVDLPKQPVKNVPADGVYTWSTDESLIIWVGRNVVGKSHSGTMRVSGGSVTIENGAIAEGEVIMDMSSIAPLDMEDGKAARLTNHLKSADFFDVENHPEASFKLSTSSIENLNAALSGVLTVKGISGEENCQSAFSGSGENGIVFSGGLLFDRSKYGVEYNSKTVFGELGDDTIEDDIRIKFDLTGSKEAL